MGEISFALAAGLVAAFNPCGFALLPSYLALLVAAPGAGGVWRALRLSTAMTAGFITVFGLFGLVISVLTVSIQPYLPWVTVVVGFGLIALGGWLLTGRELLLRLPRLRAAGPTGSVAALYGYGASYAVASLSCTIAPFLAVTGIASGTDQLVDGLVSFVAYGVGMGLIVGLLSMLVALAQTTMVARMRRLLPYVSRVSGGLLVLAGAYIAYYGWYELRVNDGAAADDPIVRFATGVQGAISRRLDALGVRGVVIAFVVIAGFALTARALRARHGNTATSAGAHPGGPTDQLD